VSKSNVPPRVKDVTEYWTKPPPEPSARLLYWRERFAKGWRPNIRIAKMGYHEKAEFYGVYIWEYLNELTNIGRA
jgi:hypothetical protein